MCQPVRTPTIEPMKHIAARRAFTLLELVITMSITIVMMVMVVSFSVMCNSWANLGTARYDLLTSERLARVGLTEFLSYYDSNDYYLTTNTSVVAVHRVADGAIVSTLQLQEDMLQFDAPDGQPYQFKMDGIERIRFAVEQSSYNDNVLVCIYMHYTLPTINKAGSEVGVLSVVASARAMGVVA